jgi:hypothetical protein
MSTKETSQIRMRFLVPRNDSHLEVYVLDEEILYRFSWQDLY